MSRRPASSLGEGRGEGVGEAGGDLLSRGVSARVPSALRGLTTGFGMGPGVTPSLVPPTTCFARARIPALRSSSPCRLEVQPVGAARIPWGRRSRGS
jgi:hypothetical protein